MRLHSDSCRTTTPTWMYTGYRVSGRTAIQTVGDAPVVRLRWSRGHRVSLSSPHWVRLETTRCLRAEAAEAVIEQVRELCEQTTVSVSIGCRCYTDSVQAPVARGDRFHGT